MLPEKPWKLDALVRLAISVVICVTFVGGLVSSAVAGLAGAPGTRPALFLVLTAAATLLFVAAIILLGRAWVPEKFIGNFLLLLLCLYGGLLCLWLGLRFQGDVAPGFPNTTARTVVMVLSFQGAALLLVHRFLREHDVTWAEAFGFKRHVRPALLLGTVAGAAIVPVGWGLQVISAMLIQMLYGPPVEQEAVQVLRAAENWSDRAVLGIAAVVVAPVAEEVLFRGILYPSIKRAGYPRLALWGSALVFGIIHLNLATFLPLTVLAIALVWLYERTGNLLAPVAAHVVFNAANFVMLFVFESLKALPPAS